MCHFLAVGHVYTASLKRQHVAHHVEVLLMLFIVVCRNFAQEIILISLCIVKLKGFVKILPKRNWKIYDFSYGVPWAFSFTQYISVGISSSMISKRQKLVTANTFTSNHHCTSNNKMAQQPSTLNLLLVGCCANLKFFIEMWSSHFHKLKLADTGLNNVIEKYQFP